MVEDLVYDVGMHDGEDTAYYLFKGFRVVAIEANPALAAQASRRFGCEVADGRLKVLNVAIAAEPGVLPFWVCDEPAHSSFDREIAAKFGDPVRQIDVRCSRIDPIFEEHGVPFYLKVDIEGHDRICLDQLTPGDLPRYVSTEADGTVEVLRALRDLGYSRFKCISQHVFLPLEWPPCREFREYEAARDRLQSGSLFWRCARGLGAMRPMRRAVEGAQWRARHDAGEKRGWTFPRWCSGPFGEDTPGRWLGFDEMCETYLRYLEMARDASRPGLFFDAGADGDIWCDFHARRDG